MSDSGDLCNGGRELQPSGAQLVERAAAGGGDRIESAATFTGLLHPATGDPTAVFHAIQQGVERRDMKRQHALRAGFDELVELIPVASLVLEEREDEEFGAALL
jgi:hypothetical protein